jgi:hypothetical protein
MELNLSLIGIPVSGPEQLGSNGIFIILLSFSKREFHLKFMDKKIPNSTFPSFQSRLEK